jgi:hypothetical protein
MNQPFTPPESACKPETLKLTLDFVARLRAATETARTGATAEPFAALNARRFARRGHLESALQKAPLPRRTALAVLLAGGAIS